jgi:hypothetical protein
MPTYTFYDLFGAWASDLFYTLIMATGSCLFIELPIANMWRTRIERGLIEKLKKYVNPKSRSRAASTLVAPDPAFKQETKIEETAEDATEVTSDSKVESETDEGGLDEDEAGSKIAGSEDELPQEVETQA